jgi:hypothetical protein
LANDLGQLVDALKAEAPSSLGALDFQAMLIAGVGKFNADTAQPFVLTGTVLDRAASSVECRYIVLSAIYIYLTKRSIESSETAIQISNVAGRTNLDGIELALSKRRLELRADLEALLQRLVGQSVAEEASANEMGETLEFAVWRAQFPLYPSW